MMEEVVNFPENHINDKNKRGFTPLLIAIENGHLNIAKLLYRKGGDIQLRSNRGQSALHIACYKDNLNCVQFLV
jgi:ankyrin repeat protein